MTLTAPAEVLATLPRDGVNVKITNASAHTHVTLTSGQEVLARAVGQSQASSTVTEYAASSHSSLLHRRSVRGD